MSRILPTAIRSTDLLTAEGFSSKYKSDPTLPAIVLEREIDGFPWIEDRLIESGKVLIRNYLDAYYSEPTKKDSIQRRIHNAVCLLIESDNQPNNAVGLALSMTAVEALLGEKGEGIAAKLADNVAALLEPDLTQRHNATKFVTDLYNNVRSPALHGELVETESGARVNTRHLAAAVLSGMISLRIQSRSGLEPETPQELLQELRKSRFSQGQPLGVEEYNIRGLWRK
jgi:hypothetical protein